ncbi:unnamed protein product, partial [marine sediment metagenome]
EEEEEEEEPAVGAPQYGGTLTFATYMVDRNPATWDQLDIPWLIQEYGSPVMEMLVAGDPLTYGPRGTNEYSFELNEYIPERMLQGRLAESWEITTDPLGILFHIRKGSVG